ncbi:hypothetical protein Tco_0470404, partial [Tanacetum coccineum]
MLLKMQSPLCVQNKVRITPPLGLPPRLLKGEPSCNLCSTKKSDPRTDILVEQTKRCYLTEVIPFFKTLKEHFAGVQMNDEVDQNTVDKQCAEIERKNLLIA